jgi:hypothetical protein
MHSAKNTDAGAGILMRIGLLPRQLSPAAMADLQAIAQHGCFPQPRL